MKTRTAARNVSIRKPVQATNRKDTALQVMTAALDPVSVEDAMSRTDAYEWQKAMDEEIDSLHTSQTWTLVKPPAHCNIVRNKWFSKRN